MPVFIGGAVVATQPRIFVVAVQLLLFVHVPPCAVVFNESAPAIFRSTLTAVGRPSVKSTIEFNRVSTPSSCSDFICAFCSSIYASHKPSAVLVKALSL